MKPLQAKCPPLKLSGGASQNRSKPRRTPLPRSEEISAPRVIRALPAVEMSAPHCLTASKIDAVHRVGDHNQMSFTNCSPQFPAIAAARAPAL